jgi:hypothetical protein
LPLILNTQDAVGLAQNLAPAPTTDRSTPPAPPANAAGPPEPRSFPFAFTK